MSVHAPAVTERRAGAWPKVGAYVALTKPRIIELLLVTTLPTMVVAQRGLPPVWLALMRNSVARLGARFNTDRMLMEYVDELYLPAHRDLLAALAAA